MIFIYLFIYFLISFLEIHPFILSTAKGSRTNNLIVAEKGKRGNPGRAGKRQFLNTNEATSSKRKKTE